MTTDLLTTPKDVPWEKLDKILAFEGWNFEHRQALKNTLLQFQNLGDYQKIIHARDLDEEVGHDPLVKFYVTCEAANASGYLTDYTMRMRDEGVDLVIDGKLYSVGDTDMIIIGEPMQSGEDDVELDSSGQPEDAPTVHAHASSLPCGPGCQVWDHYYGKRL